MLNPIRRYRTDGYWGGCEFPNCPNKLMSKTKTKRYCLSHDVERRKNRKRFRKNLETARENNKNDR